jgi:hypothetical protein
MPLEVRQYKDLDLNFTAHPVTKDVVKRTGNAAIIGALRNLILTNLYEKPFQPVYGSRIRGLLFEVCCSRTFLLLLQTFYTQK